MFKNNPHLDIDTVDLYDLTQDNRELVRSLSFFVTEPMDTDDSTITDMTNTSCLNANTTEPMDCQEQSQIILGGHFGK